MITSESVLLFPTAGLTISAVDLVHQTTSHKQEIVRKVAEVCSWWFNGTDHLEITTSGSTGKPKVLSFSREAIKGSIKRTTSALDLKKGSTALLALDVSFIGGKMMVLRALEEGFNLICVPPSSNPLKFIAQHQSINFAAFVPLQVEAILNDAETKEQFKHISTVIIGGATVNLALRKKLESISTKTYLTFGMTETLSHIALMRISPENNSYTVLPDIKVEQDTRGCLVIEIPHIGSTPIITNDLIEKIDDQHFRWLGRMDYVINSGGIKFNPEVLESKAENDIRAHLRNGSFIFTSLPDERLSNKIVLLIFDCPQPTIQDCLMITEVLENCLDPYERPKEIRWSQLQEKNPGGKLDRKLTLAASIKLWP